MGDAEHGIIFKTDDGGITWDRFDDPDSSRLYDVSSVDASRLWVVGTSRFGGGRILASTDGGTNWDIQVPDAPQAFYAVHFPDELHGFAVGYAGTHRTAAGNGLSSSRPPRSGSGTCIFKTHRTDLRSVSWARSCTLKTAATIGNSWPRR